MGAVNSADRPLAVMHLAMVVGAEADAIVDIGFTAKLPRFDVMDIAQGCDDSTSGRLAPAIAGEYGSSLCPIEEPLGAVLI